ncbi:MAG TPA: Holliday junction resolvase RuvX [Candidatus Polarisedimenticolia bacterium]|nr:Holliday junction resolvase RuvX [Candidatus Polarisedimenticolia bacterium]
MKGDPARGHAAEGESGTGRTLALDLGDRRIGIAVSDPLGMAARPLMTLTRTSGARDLETITELTREHDVRRIVVGLPLDMDGSRGRRVQITEVFMERLRQATGLPVIPWDERLTTVQAERILLEGDVSRARRRKVIDQVAAVIVLQAYLEAQRPPGDGR